MRSEAEGFLARVRELPDDDGPRLIYADWLDDQADPRGEFIRVQVALARISEFDPRRPKLRQLERALLERYGEVWAGPYRGLASGPVFRRGFVEEVKVTARQFLAGGAALFAAGPVRHLHLLDLGGHLGQVFASPLLARLTGLTVFAQHLGDPLARAVAECPHLAGLRVLHLGRNRIGDVGVERLTASPYLGALEDLDLGENDLGEPAARALAQCPRLTGLRRLELGASDAGPRGRRALALDDARTEHGWNAVGPAGAEAIARSPHFGRLERLGLAGNRLGGPRLAAVAGPSALTRVAALDLSDCRLTAADLPALLGREQTGLRELNLSSNDLGDEGAAFLAETPAVARLRVLRLTETQITDAGLEMLANSSQLKLLVALDLGNNQIGDSGFRALLRSRPLRHLRQLAFPGYGVSKWMQNELERKYPPDLLPA